MERRNLVIFICGMRSSGKSTLARDIAGERDRVFFMDAMGEGGADGSYEIVSGRRECIEAMLACAKRDRFRLALQLDHTDDYLDLMRMAYEIPEQLTLVDETSLYCSASYLPPEVSKLIRMGRHRAIDQIYIARRPSEISRDLTANADIGVTFIQHEPIDLRYLRSVAGPVGEQARVLAPYRVLAWGPGLDRAPLAVIQRLDTQAPTRVASKPSEPVETEDEPDPPADSEQQ